MQASSYLLSIAPMMDRTDRHFRYLMRRLTKRTWLYTEMVTTHALLRGARDSLLRYHPIEHPIVLQLGGDSPHDLAACAVMAEDKGYDEVNINCGCPSDRVQSGRFGACLMKDPQRVADCVAEIKAKVKIPVSVKQRIGVDEFDKYEDMARFVDVVSKAEPIRFTVHARKAWLKGLSPKENRTIPPLRYNDVYQLKQQRPDLFIEINGGITQLADVQVHLTGVDAVMIGRAAYDDPLIFTKADSTFWGVEDPDSPTLKNIVEYMLPYIQNEQKLGTRAFSILRHMMGLVNGQRGGRAFRRVLSERGPRQNDANVLADALSAYEAARREAI